MHRIAVLPGDGIGPEITREVVTEARTTLKARTSQIRSERS